MNLRKALTIDDVIPEVSAPTVEGVIREMVAFLDGRGKLRDAEAALQSVLEREKKMSTGVGHGVAIPHGKTDTVDELVTCIGRSAQGVDFAGPDGESVHILVMTISPANRTGPHIQFISEIARLLKESDRRRAYLAAEDAAGMYGALLE